MIPSDERTERPASLPNYRKFPAPGDYFERVTTATRECIDWYQHDGWNKRFGRKIRLLGSEENRAFLDMIREHVPGFSEVPVFILPDPSSRRWERIALQIEWFCEGASFVLDRSVPDDAENPTFEDVQEPRAWVSDRNCAPEGLPPPQRVYGKVLNCIELYAVLQKKVFYRESSISERSTHGGEYKKLIEFVFQALSRRRLRRHGWSSSTHSERYWTAVFLDEDFYVDQPRLSVEEEDVVVGSIDPIIIQAEMRATATTASPRAYALASLAATLRGIVEHHADIQEEFGASLDCHTSNTRYDPPENISREDIQEWRKDFQDTLGPVMYGNSRLLRKVDEFLTQDLLISPDGLPHSPLWSGLQEEPGVVNSLRSIIKSRNSLRDIQNEFLQFIEEAKRERKNHHVDEQQTFSRQLQQFTVATLVSWVSPWLEDLR
ncbi:hypothetical protein BFJ70_g16746 [Fusarium oxysporum]|nr:hypothetical protein BFJ70_g16746 [Fusarium oxysporum]